MLLPDRTMPDIGAPRGQRVVDTPIGLAVTLTGLWFVLLAFLQSLPEIDIAVQSLVFRPGTCATGRIATVCGSFPLAGSALVTGMRTILYELPFVIATAMLFRLVGLARTARPVHADEIRRLGIGLATFALGPGLLVNLVLKSHSGRPRPYQTDLFGGTLDFRPAGTFDGACGSNCSFVSGEAAGAAWLICLVPLLPPARRRLGYAVAAAAALMTAFIRVGFGRHYLSDVVLGGLSTIVVFMVIGICLRRRPSPKSHQ